MVAVLAIAYGRHCEDESCLWETVADELYGFVEVGGALGDGQLPLLKQALGPFLAVVNYLARLLENCILYTSEAADDLRCVDMGW